MSRAFDFLVVGIVVIMSVIMMYLGLVLFEPGTPLFEFAAQADNLSGESRATLWFEMLTVWTPLIADGGIILWALIREYRRQAVTAARPVR